MVHDTSVDAVGISEVFNLRDAMDNKQQIIKQHVVTKLNSSAARPEWTGRSDGHYMHLQSGSSAALPALPSVAPSMLSAATETAVNRSRSPRLSRMRSDARCGNDVLSILQGPPNTPRSVLNSTSSTTRKQEKKEAVGIYVQQCNDFKPCPAGRGCYVMQSVPWD
jgi:hypothetical protein